MFFAGGDRRGQRLRAWEPDRNHLLTVSGNFELSLPAGHEGAGNSLFIAGGRFVDLFAGNNSADHVIRPARAQTSRLFTIDGALVRLSGVTLTQGGVGDTDGHGGAISIEGVAPRMEIVNAVIENSAASWRGGGIYADGGGNSSLVIDGGQQLWRPSIADRETVRGYSRKIEGTSRQVGIAAASATTPQSKL